MTSYMYNPSQKVTEILSKFFEFDPSELDLGIWSGDLQLKNVKLRQEAIHPLLNKQANKPHTDPLKKAPLHMKLVSGTVGNMRIRIPWKRLVWGQGAVQLDISDVMIVLALQSREETEEQRRKGLLKVKDKKKNAEEDSGVSKAYREAKQRRLREAERRHQQGMPVALYLDNLHRKNSIAREAAKAEEASKNNGSSASSSSKSKEPGRIDKWLKNTGSDLFWRFFAGIQGSITKARIVVVQDGVEVGCIIQSIEVVAGKDGTKVNVNMADEDPSEMSEEARTAAEMTPPETFMYEGAYEDGEHVDKTIKQQGLGLFIRKEVSMAKVPKALRFSTSVSADDYILRPVDLDLSFSFFYPYPPERRKKRAIDNLSQETPTTAASSTGLSGAVSVGESTTASSKQRRGKRERDRVTPSILPGTTHSGATNDEDRRGKLRPTQSLTRNRFVPMTPAESRLRNQHRRLVSDSQQNQGGRPRLQRHASMRSARSSSFFTAAGQDTMSIQESATVVPGRSMEIAPKFDCRVTLKEIRIVFTTRHYELLNYFLSTVSRMKNGRPDLLIRSTPKETNTASFQRKFIDATSGSFLPATPVRPKQMDHAAKPNATMLSAMLAPLTGFRGGASDNVEHEGSASESNINNPQLIPVRRSVRSQVLVKWWKYSIGAITWEVRKRKHLATNFRQMYISFDWNRQRYKRKEYIELYIASKLDNKQDGVWPFEDNEKREDKLLRIEDELPLEQILLYRSIARSIRVRGMTKMPDSIKELHSAQTMKMRAKRKKRESTSMNDKGDDEAAETSLLSMIQQKFNSASQLRQPGGLFKKFRSSTGNRSMFPTDLRSDQDYDNDYDAQSSDVVRQPSLINQGRFTPEVSGHDSTIDEDREARTPSFRRAVGKQTRRGSTGNSISDIHPGNFYSSGRDASQADGRTIRTFQRKDARSARPGQTIGSADDTISKPDERMKISLALSIKLFDFMVVEEEYLFDIAPEELKRPGKSEKDSVGDLSREYYSGGEESSSDDVSDLSVLTDDQRFFNEGGPIEPIMEEEDEEVGAKMSSTDFLLFGLPEEPLLRLTINSLGCSVRGRSGGRLNLGVSIRRISALSENENHIFSMGAYEATTPISEVNVGSVARRKSFDSFDMMDLSTPLLNRQESLGMSSRGRGTESGRAVSLMICSDEAFKDVQCDLSKIAVTLDLVPATKLLHFYSKSEIKFPDRIVEKSSGDVARKFMVYKTSSQGRVGIINTAIRVRGLEVRVPLVKQDDDVESSEDSNVDLSNSYDDDSPFIAVGASPKSALIFSSGSLDIFSGAAVDEMSAVTDLSASRSSLFSGSFASRKTAAVPTKTLEMLDIAELTEATDSFSCRHVVATMGGINCFFETKAGRGTKVIDVPVDVEVLLTTNETSLLETELPKNQLVLEVSPVHLLLSKERLEMISATKESIDFSALDTSSKLMKKMRKPDPPRIEILSRRILHCVDLNCRRVQLSIVKDTDQQTETISPKLKEIIMEECLSDFISIVSCFDFSLPNEEALSSAMQVCIGRLVGLGLSDDEAWGCTNAARLNFLDDIALMRRAQTDALVQLSSNMHQHPSLFKSPLHEEGSDDEETSSSNSSSSVEISLADSSAGAEEGPSLDTPAAEDESEDDVSANSADIVDTTLQNAVEKTVATFAPLLQTYRSDFKDLHLNSILTLDLPLGFSMSSVKLFYDFHITFLVTSLVATNSAGVELLTLVPQSTDEEKSLDEDEEAAPGQGICFSRYDLDEDHDFGKGGLPMSALASDDEEGAFIIRKRSRYDDIEIGEVEFLFSSKVYEGIIDEISKLGNQKQNGEDFPADRSDKYASTRGVESSLVLTSYSVSALFTSDELVPFARLTLERVAYRNSKGLEHSAQKERPSWLLVAEAAALQNLTPEGQFYPDTMTLLSPAAGDADFPFQVHYFKSSDPWKQSSRLFIDFKGFRLFLVRQFIHEILQFFVYDKYGVGRLKKKYSKDVRDVHGNPRPPLLWTVRVDDTSIVCPRSSTSSDMAAFEVQKALIAVSYIPESFKMPTETSPFDPAPSGKTRSNKYSDGASRRNSFLSTASEYHECMDEPLSDVGDDDSDSPIPISSFTAELRKRICINLERVQVFTVIASNTAARDAVESPLFRFFHALNGHAADGKLVYTQKPNVDRQTSVPPESLRGFEKFEQRWEEISTRLLDVEVFADYAPHMRLLIGSRHGPFDLDARMSQLCLLLSVWDSNMQEMPAMFPFFTDQVTKSATPPEIPDDFPAYGTDDFVKHLEDTSSIRSEICCIFKSLSLRCTFDPPGYFSVDPECFQYFEDPSCPDDEKPGLVLTLEDANIHVLNDFLNLRRIGIGASFLELIDERRTNFSRKVLSTSRVERGGKTATTAAWADVGWGLRNDIRTLSSSLPMPVIFTVFMTPGWSLINVGAESANGVMHELSWIWLFLGYFKSYYTDVAFGNPGHQAQRWTHKLKNALRKSNGEEPIEFQPLPGVNVDFRLWLCKPVLCIPSDYFSSHAPCLRIESRTGLWYRYKSIQTLSSQEVSTTDLNLYFSNDFQKPEVSRRSDVREGVAGARPLVEGLSFGLRYDSNNLYNHKDVSVLIPFAGEDTPSLSVAGPELEVRPTVLPTAVVCKPMETLSRRLGPKVCEITCIIELLPITLSTMMNFFKGPTELNPDFLVPEEDNGPVTYSVSAEVHDLRIFAIDPVLGVQLPVGVASIASLQLTATKFTGQPVKLNLEPGEAPPEDLQLTVRSHLWADYFKLGMTRSWEPLLEPFDFALMYEQAKERGQGCSVEADSPFHVNLSGAFLQILGETVESFSTLIKETFGEKSNPDQALRRSVSLGSPSRDRAGAFLDDSIRTTEGYQVQVLHEIPKPLKSEDRMAFSFRNLTGQKVRVHQQTDRSTESALKKPAIVTYLNQKETMGLTFAATISVIKNLSVVEVPYPGLPNSAGGNQNQGSLKHAVDLQVPGFRWIQGIKVDSFGRRFEILIPRSIQVHAKMLRDWRLKNAMMVLTEVGLDNGGRLVTVRSLFEIRNSTTHPIKLVYNPDPRRRPVEDPEEHSPEHIQDADTAIASSVVSQHFLAPVDEIEIIQPGSTFQIPTLLLERSLQMTGSHLGCLWLCPDTNDKSMPFWSFFRSNGSVEEEDLEASFSSKPIQLAKLVHESSVMFQNGTGEDIPPEEAKSGVQVSCPTRVRKGGARAPFCYAIEVGRSPLVNINRERPDVEMKESLQGDGKKPQRKKAGADKKSKKVEEKIHGPVAYSLSIHAPLVIANLLPEGGRFELMHAIRKTVVWYADLKPGQQIAVHSVGLDAPLLLLVNLGFCRTPVGEGALVHHGADSYTGRRGEQGTRFKSIGKAALKGTKQIGKTLTAISDSPDRRGQGRLAQVNAPQFYNRQNRKDKTNNPHANQVPHGSLGLDTEAGDLGATGGKIHSVESVAYSQNDIATETTVVDGIGQRLSLSLENVRGGGGQRRVSLFCPFWIVNTTEHSLRYKQDKGKSFVSGTVISPEKDGSRPVDGSNRNYRMHHKNQASRRKSSKRHVMLLEPEGSPMNSKTIFAGTPGALATTPGRCGLEASELAELIDKELSLERMAQLAFMFNFHDEGLSIGHQMLSVQLFDGSGEWDYSSDWSRGFSLDSVGFSQIVSMSTKEGRAIELSVEVNVAPGLLSSYTKIVRFVPRYVVYNRLERPIRLWQDSSVFRPENEDRAANSDGIEINREARKWRYHYEDKNSEEKINQYETLYGRPSTIKDNSSPRTEIIAGGTTAHRSALYITTIGPSEIAPFLLPDTRAERQLRVDLGGIWNVSSSFASDLPGEHSLKVSRATDLRMLNHVSTRAAPKYKIVLPPPEDSGMVEWDGELGVFFETDWGVDKRIIVKGTKRGRFAYNHTDIHVGDELLRIDGISVTKMSFAEAMKLIKERVAFVRSLNLQPRPENTENARRQGRLRRLSVGVKRRNSGSQIVADDGDVQPRQLTLTFRTLEERLRKLRGKASTHEEPNSGRETERDSTDYIMDQTAQLERFNVEMKSLHNTMFVILREPDKENPPFEIQNRSINHVVFYRQRGCESHPWNFVFPGESMPYSWEEPMRSKKLTVRVAAKSQEVFKPNNGDASSQGSISEFEIEQDLDGDPVSSPEHEQRAARVARLRQALAYQFVNTEERGGYGPSITVRLEEIGYRTFLPIPSKDGANRRRKFLNCEVDTDGGTRLLVVSDDAGSDDDRSLLKRHLDTLRKQISYEEQRIAGLSSLQYLLSKESTENAQGKNEDHKERIEVIEGDARRFVEDFSEDTTISRCHQVVVEVIEAVGLNVSDFVGNCNPYCEIFLKGRSKSRQYFFQKRRNKRKTYFIEKSLNPKWTDQTFIFDVPEEAVRVTRGHHLLVKVRNFRLVGQHPILGQAAVHFGSLRNQQELVGWYPLAGRTGRSDVETVQLSDASRGSIKLRVHWVYTSSALIDYFLMLSQARLGQLSRSRDGMMEQLSHAIDSDERKRESKESGNAGRIKKLAKLEKKMAQKTPKKSRKTNKKRDQEKDNVVGKLNQGINSSLTVLKGTLKASRDRYLYALYYQTAESKRNRQMEEERQSIANQDESVGASTSVSDQVGTSSDPKSPGSLNGQQEDQKRSLEQYLTNQRGRALIHSPQMHETFQKNKQTLDAFFAGKSPQVTKSPFPAGKARVRLDSAGSPRRASRRLVDSEHGRHLVSHRRLSMDIDDPLGEEASLEHGENWRSAVLDGVYSQSADWGISDLVSVGTEIDEEAKRKRNTRILVNLGFLFHECGVYFHENHLPHHFRRSLFASSMEERRTTRLYRPKFAVGSPSVIRHFKSWQAAGTLHIDPELEVTATSSTFTVQFKKKKPEILKNRLRGPDSKEIIDQRLQVPDTAPSATKERSTGRVETLYLSRCRFERAAKRTLGAVLNPGGWLTVRPITALNLPDGYNGMFVRLRYGSETLVSETVDARVTPRWGSLDILDSQGTRSNGPRKSFSPRREEVETAVKWTQNDLHVHVEPQQTSGTVKISVIAERMNNKTELGVLEIPLGAAIAACLDEHDEEVDLDNGPTPPLYVRWFPLLSPRLVVPVEGDMGTSSRSAESEKPRDSMFQQYFAPCIQLALMWWPENTGAASNYSNENEEGGISSALGLRGPSNSPRAVAPPAVQSYFNLDLSRVSAALIDSQRAIELLSFTAMDLDIRYSVTKTKTRMGVVVAWIQLDHQDPRAREPVVFAPTPSEVMQPTLQILALKDNLRTKSNIVSYEYIGVALQEMDLTVEESWIFELWDFFMGVMRRRKAKRNSRKGQQRADFLLSTENCFASHNLEGENVPSLLSALSGEAEGGSSANRRKIYIEQLILGLVKVNLSYVKGKKQSFELTDKGAKVLKNLEVRELPNLALAATGIPFTEGMHRGDQSEVFVKWSQHTYDEDLMDSGGYNLPGIIAAVFPSVSDAPIRLQGKVIDHVFESGGEIVSSIKNFYVNETLKQVYKIIGSLDFVGNPTILFSSFVSGVRDLVAAPTSAFLKSPTNVNQVGIAVGKGTLSLFSHSASGIFGFAAKMSATAGQAAAILSLDTEYSQWHRDRIVNEATNLNREWKRRGIQSVPEMLTRPVGDIILGVAMGASGLIISPYKGFKKGGGLGFARGVAVGTAGVVAKPLVGVLDAFTHFSATIHDVAKSVNVLERRYQPSLKLRLPYTFGPMNILSPFDPICSRSVNLLRIFPPKTKRNRKGKRAPEIYVHSEVLHMEPGVDTFAIATTIRVVLIRLRKDTTGALLPALGWEVELGNNGTVVSRVSDHGHNGVALTITRRVADDKAIEEVKDSTKIKRSKRVQEAIKSPRFSSALSMDSGFSDLEDDDDIEVNAELPSEGAEHAQLPQGDDPEADEEADPTFDHGATKKGGEVVKWFTVLAEYQHRRQLTTLHNAISALVGNFDAIVIGHTAEFKGGKEGVSTFGIFNFEKPSEDQRSVYASNAELVASLENLPWMHEDVFATFEKSSERKKKEYVASIRQNWSLASALEGSKKEGGPAWLVEARARAMFPTSESLAVADFLDPDDPVVREVMFEHEEMKVLASVLPSESENEEESDFDADGSLSIEGLEDGINVGGWNRSLRKGGTTGKLAGGTVSTTEENRPRDRIDNDDELFHSTELHGSVSNGKESGSSASLNRSDENSFEKMETPMHSVSSLDNQEMKSLSGHRGSDRDLSSFVSSPCAIDNAREQKRMAYNKTKEASRMDKMETLMEQLVIINAQQLQKQSPPVEISGDAHSLGESRAADMLKQEVAELRSQVQARAAEDDALRNEITLLRQQLAERREQRTTKIQERPSRLKIPEILRFGSGSKKEEGSHGAGGKQFEMHGSSADLSESIIETPLKDGAQEHRGINRKSQRRMSGDTFASAELIPATKRMPTVEPSLSQTASKMGKRPSEDGTDSGIMLRRSSIGSEVRASGRRLSGEHQVRWE